MSETELFITGVQNMREAQKDFFENRTRSNLATCKQLEGWVDAWLEKHITEKVQLDFYRQGFQTGETAAVYNVGDEIKDENAGAT